MQRMVQACAYPVALIVAPAGYGKTVALRQYLQSLDLPHVRFDVRPEHETLPGFVRGFAEAVAHVAPEMRAALGDALRGPSTAAHLAEWAATHLRDFRGVIAMDDLHLALDHGVALFLRSLTERLKGQVRWVFASRSAPQLPIATWMTYGDMDIAVDERDLAFTVEEAKQAGNETGACEDELRRFVEMTGGWATALSFAMRSRVRTSELEEIGHATREMVYRYLAEQVYDQLSDVERQLLHLAAYLPTIDVDLLVAAGFPDAYAMLEQLRKRTAFLSIEGQRTYRCHDLFRDFLRDRVELMGSAVSRELQLRAAALLQNAGNSAAALRMFAELQAFDQIRSALENAGLELFDKGLWDAAERAISVLPPHLRERDITVLAISASLEKNRGNFVDAELLLKAAIELASDPVTRAMLFLKLASLGFEQLRDVAPLLEPLDWETLPLDVAGEVASFLVATYSRFGREDDARNILPHAEKLAELVTSQHIRAKLYHRCGIAAMHLELPRDEVYRYFSEAVRISVRHKHYVTATAAYGGLAIVAAICDDNLHEYRRLATKCLEVAEKAGDAFSIHQAAARVVDAQAHVGEFDGINDALALMKRTATDSQDRECYITSSKAMLLAKSRRFADAYKMSLVWLGDSNYDRVNNLSMRAMYANLAGLHREALDACDMVTGILQRERFTSTHACGSAELGRLIVALVLSLEGAHGKAERLLTMRPFGMRGYSSLLQSVVEYIARSRSLPDDAVLSDAFEALRRSGRGGVATVLRLLLAQADLSDRISLTPAEIDVFRALDKGRTPKEIAALSGRSVHTVRTLIQRGTEKLGCRGRQETLAMVRGMGLLGLVPEQDAPPPGDKASEL